MQIYVLVIGLVLMLLLYLEVTMADKADLTYRSFVIAVFDLRPGPVSLEHEQFARHVHQHALRLAPRVLLPGRCKYNTQ